MLVNIQQFNVVNSNVALYLAPATEKAARLKSAERHVLFSFLFENLCKISKKVRVCGWPALSIPYGGAVETFFLFLSITPRRETFNSFNIELSLIFREVYPIE